MPLIKCPKCGAKISDRADKCPKCGINPKTYVEPEQLATETPDIEEPERKKNKPLETIVIGLIIILVGALAVLIGNFVLFNVLESALHGCFL